MYLLIFSFILSSLGFSGELKIEKDEARLNNQIMESDGSPVLPHQGRYMGHGYIVGSPINSGYTGLFYKTYEIHINQGRFTDDRTYLGSSVSLSIDNRDAKIFKDFQNIENQNHELFVFEYDHKSGWNPEIEDSHFFLKKIYTISEFLDHISGQDIPQGIKARNPRPGSNGTKRKVGRIVDVERLGLIGDFCVMEVNLGGLSSTSGGASAEAIVTIAIVDEDICVWVEKAIAYGRDVEVDLSEDVIEFWQPSTMFVTAIKFKIDEDDKADADLEVKGLSEEQYAELKARLIKDPAFLEQLLHRMTEDQ